jgi:hypothetical protein
MNPAMTTNTIAPHVSAQREVAAPKNGLRCRIFTDDRGRSPGNVVSYRCREVTLVDAGVYGPDEPTPDAPAVKIVRRNLGGREYVHIEPVAPPDSGCCRMFGGTIIYTSDSRFGDAVRNGGYPVKFHDRDERHEQ